ncbi:MAG: carbohydrate ABC transporter permease, partial [Lachnospiraceae bacterium]|nr:carbohydrate ABC transporter permease [Lachnospiraceae bacterium]
MKNKGLGLKSRRLIAYIVLGVIAFFCLFWFYVLFINASRSHSELTKGFTLVPSTHLLENWVNVMNGTLPIVRGMLNSLIIAGSSAVLCTYFSAMTAYAIHAYTFKLRNFMFTFILIIMMIPTQVNAQGFLQ